jgi:ribosomal protein S18 acetylase RimI-like enzyme
MMTMAMRSIELPGDLAPLAEMLVETFQYPENEAWNVQTDEKEQLISGMRNLRRIWPLIRLTQILSPPLRDIFCGYVWENDGRLAGSTIVQRRGTTEAWYVNTVGVLPACRRQGIARKLLEAALDLIRERGGKKVVLDVIDGNVPAYALYEGLGFEHYDGHIEFQTTPEKTPPEPVLPEGYTQSPLGRFDWQPRYELEERISPQNLLKYEPMEVGRFRLPAMMRLLFPLVMFAQGQREEGIAVHTVTEGRIVARGAHTVPSRGKGLNRLAIRLDPDHPHLALYLVRYLLYKVMTLSPGRRVELAVPQWMEAVVAAVKEAGFERRLEYCCMGLLL